MIKLVAKTNKSTNYKTKWLWRLKVLISKNYVEDLFGLLKTGNNNFLIK